MLAVPVPAGVIAVTDVGETTLTPVAGVDPKRTAVAPPRFVPVRVTDLPPSELPEFGVTNLSLGAGGTAATTSTNGLALTVLVPETDRANLYLIAFRVVLAGTVTSWLTLPDVQGAVTGNPETVGVEEKVQLVALATTADRVTVPPERGSPTGVEANVATVGGRLVIGVRWDGGVAGGTVVGGTVVGTTGLVGAVAVVVVVLVLVGVLVPGVDRFLVFGLVTVARGARGVEVEVGVEVGVDAGVDVVAGGTGAAAAMEAGLIRAISPIAGTMPTVTQRVSRVLDARPPSDLLAPRVPRMFCPR
jgi:hypothetical protein